MFLVGVVESIEHRHCYLGLAAIVGRRCLLAETIGAVQVQEMVASYGRIGRNDAKGKLLPGC
jgi:hypothetical protein